MQNCKSDFWSVCRSTMTHFLVRKINLNICRLLQQIHSKISNMKSLPLQPEVHAVQVVIFIHTACSCSFHSCNCVTPQSSTSLSWFFLFRSRLVYMLWMVLDRFVYEDKTARECLSAWTNTKTSALTSNKIVINNYENKHTVGLVWANRIFPSNWPDFSHRNFKAIFEGLGLSI